VGVVDFLHGSVVIETVGMKWHLSKFNADHHRYARLEAARYRLVPFTFDDVEFNPAHVVRAARGATEQPRPGPLRDIPTGMASGVEAITPPDRIVPRRASSRSGRWVRGRRT
ncbi:MAG: hypothetical protein ACKV2O_19470, partial [Acidimicrobiales bacterium]